MKSRCEYEKSARAIELEFIDWIARARTLTVVPGARLPDFIVGYRERG